MHKMHRVMCIVTVLIGNDESHATLDYVVNVSLSSCMFACGKQNLY